MSSPFIDRIRTIVRANPAVRNITLRLLGFVWLTCVVGVIAKERLESVVPTTLILIAMIITVVAIAFYLFLLRTESATIYYRIFLPIYEYANNRKHRFVHWAWSLLGIRNDHWLDLILQSQQWNRKARPEREGLHDGGLFAPRVGAHIPPLVVRREHIDSRYIKGERSFSIVLLFNQLRLYRDQKKVVLEVDLRGQSCAIYSNRGKEFIREKFLADCVDEYRDVSQKSHTFLMGASGPTEYPMSVNALRWTSGGFLPVANWRGRKWVCLFFRDIDPIGWNIANGASESKEEYKKINRLIYREMLEELVICSDLPKKHRHVQHRILSIPGLSLADPESPVLHLLREHVELRQEHDGIILALHFNGPSLREKQTKHEVRVLFHDDWADASPGIIQNVLLSVNPLELGIEVIRVGEFDLGDHEFLLDGEVFSTSETQYLVRRPVAMISTDFLKARFSRCGDSLSSTQFVDSQYDRKTLEDVPVGEFHVFMEDIRLGLARLEYLRQEGDGKSKEAIRLARWHDKAGLWFDKIVQGGSFQGELALLLPGTWKTIELAIRQKVL